MNKKHEGMNQDRTISSVKIKSARRVRKDVSPRTFLSATRTISKVRDSCITDKETGETTLSKKYCELDFTIDYENELPIITPDEIMERLIQLTERQQPYKKGFLSIGKGTIVGRTQIGESIFCVVIYSEILHKRIWNVYDINGGDVKGVFYLK